MRGLNIHTHTHKRNRLLGFFFFSLYILDILNLKIFFFLFLYSSAGGWGMCIPTFVDFFLFHLFFFFVSFVFFFLLFFSRCSQGPYCIFFSFFFVRSLPDSFIPRFIPIFFSSGFFFILVNGAIVKRYPLTPHINFLSLLTISLLSRPVIN